jgi:hypothetical protein
MRHCAGPLDLTYGSGLATGMQMIEWLDEWKVFIKRINTTELKATNVTVKRHKKIRKKMIIYNISKDTVNPRYPPSYFAIFRYRD